MTLLLLLGIGWATAAPLTEAAMAAAVDARVPDLAAAEAKLAEAEGKRLGARGAFDPKLGGKVEAEVAGPYERLYADTYLSVQTGLGPSLEVGHRVGTGAFPDYYGQYDTLDGGELRLGVSVPLLQDLGMTAERASRLLADRGVDAASAALEDKRQQLIGKAVQALWKWSATGEKRALAEELLQLAEDRQASIERQVALGAMPEVEAVDNGRVVLTRRGDRRLAEMDDAMAGLALSYFLRGPDAAPHPPDAADRPLALPEPREEGVAVDALVSAAVAARPDLRVLDALLAAAEVERRRARSVVLPELDLVGGVAKDAGAGDPKLGKTEVDAGVRVAVPLLLRKGRGEVARTGAAVDRVAAERRARVDAMGIEIRQLVATRDAAADRWRLATDTATQAARVATLERRAFELGASDIFKLNKREETLAKARKDLIEARLQWHLADAALRTATARW